VIIVSAKPHNHKSRFDPVLSFGIQADRWEIITRSTGPADIHDAWWRLLTKGMQQVLCLLAEVDSNGEIRLTGRQMRLCG